MRGPPSRHPDDDAREQLPAPEGIIERAEELKAGDRVVYPNQGVCRVIGWEVQDISGQRLELVRMAREEDGAAVMVPKGKVPAIGLRRVASGEQMEGVFHYLAAQFDDPELDWKVRHRDNADRLIAGGVLGVAEVVKGLHSLSRLRPLPTKEREQYDNARHLLVHEVAVSLGVPPGVAEDYVDFALMPPAGVTFKLKPPPTPVLLPSRPRKRRPVAAEEEGDLGLGDLGLGDLGIDIEGALGGTAEGEAAGEGEGGAEGEAAEGGEPARAGAEPEAEEEEEAAAPKGRPAPPAPPRAPARKKAAEAPAPERPAAKRAAAKAPASRAPAAKAPAAKRAPEKPAAKKKAPARAAPKAAARAAAEKPARKTAARPAARAEKKPAAKRGGKKK